ncbi:MAG: hypothetical protein QGM50_05935 [Anaerolineae bacterium]|nr:hypothetical protein [Anaerolineae bacterium]MDK1081925.1 hypothetical protein [Anaerolineae bacterium]MDK1118318.1 hypothetical protein [Anaerolineae bacterium]
MVHALNEIRRVLVPEGILIDLRPIQGNRLIEVVSIRKSQEVGTLEDFDVRLADLKAANAAIEEIKNRGWFVMEKGAEFGLHYYWDTPSEMKEFMDTEWENSRKLEDSVYQVAQSVWAASDGDARMRTRTRMLITRWKKLG